MESKRQPGSDPPYGGGRVVTPTFLLGKVVMSKRLAGKVALITGGARGIGAATVVEMAREGAAVFATDLRDDEGENLVAELRGQGLRGAFAVQDVTQEAGWDEICAAVMTKFGPIDILVNNAGIAIPGSIEDQTFADWRKAMAVNLDAVFLGTRAGVRAMKHRGGSIINVSSIEGIVGNPHVPAYNASKGGVRLLTKSAALHCARAGYAVRINSLHPGYVDTAMVQDALTNLPGDFADRTLQRIPLGRFGDAAEIARAAVFLASDQSSYMTGAELVIDGGYTA